jgi:ribonuclease R
LSDDFYQFDPARGHLVGRRTRRVFKLGDKVEVQVAKVDTFKRQVDYRLAAPADGKAKASKPHGGRADRPRQARGRRR